jgi:hypothetical protein
MSILQCLKNKALSVIISINNCSRHGVDLLSNPPYIDIYVQSKFFIVGGKEVASTEKYVILEPDKNEATMQRSEIRLEDSQRFQIGPSKYED